MNTEQRIKLAEAMGYVTTRKSVEWHGEVWEGKTPHGEATWRLPDPFTDANDDYAVLEWMRNEAAEQHYDEAAARWQAFKNYFLDLRSDWNIWNYETGLFARAALHALEIA